MYSLSRTLAVRFSLTLFVALFLIASWAYVGAQRTLRSELDRGLAAAFELSAAPLAANRPLPVQPAALEWEPFVRRINRFVAVRDAAGGIVETNTALAADLPLNRESFARARAGARVWTTQQWKGKPMRALYGPAPPVGRSEGAVIQVAASLAPLKAAGAEIVVFLVGVLLLGTGATAVGAGWLARRSVHPVQEIADQAGALRPGTVGHRITAHADVAEFHGLIEVLNRMLERLDRGLESERRLVRDVAHDLRTPLTAMRGELELALRGERDTETYRRVLASVLEEVDHLASITEALLLLARIESGELAPEREPTDVTALVRSAAARMGGRADAHRLQFRGPGAVATADADRYMLSVLVEQLLDNAVRHTPPGTDVEVAVRDGPDQVAIVVEDSGPGLPPELLPHIFERFYRGDTARSRGSGPGLGLSIAAAITEAHGGSIVAGTGARGGLRINITLPKVRPAMGDRAQSKSPGS